MATIACPRNSPGLAQEETLKPANDLQMFKDLLLRGFEVHDKAQEKYEKHLRDISVVWIDVDHTAMHYGPRKHCLDAKEIKLDDIVSVEKDEHVNERITINWALSDLHDGESISFDVDTETSRNIITRMLASVVGVHQEDSSTATSPIWGGGLKTHFDPNPTPKSYAASAIEAI